MGLLDRIRKASTWAEVNLLLLEGDSYTNPATRTKRRWKEAAKKRHQELVSEQQEG